MCVTVYTRVCYACFKEKKKKTAHGPKRSSVKTGKVRMLSPIGSIVRDSRVCLYVFVLYGCKFDL
jgi:hypothetical protein